MSAADIPELEQRLRTAVEAGQPRDIAEALVALGDRYSGTGDTARAAPCYERVAGIDRAPPALIRRAAAGLVRLVRAADERPAKSTAPEARADARFRRALEAVPAFLTVRDRAGLLDDAIDRAIDLVRAERGFLALREGSSLVLKAARDLTGTALREPDLAVSRSILDDALRRKEPILSTDAVSDVRFRAQASVRALKIRSVVAVALPGAQGPLGAMLLDHRLKKGAFGREDAELLRLYAAAVGLALERLGPIAGSSAPPAGPSHDVAPSTSEAAGSASGTRRRTDARANADQGGERGEGGADPSSFCGMLGRSPPMRTVFRLVERVAHSDLPVFIHGETGTGKELVARALHARSPRREGPFVSESCAALPESLLESELFGFERGAFTGAIETRPGLIERANGGTLLLDEVAEMSPALQGKLLRALQEREVRRVGGGAPKRVDVRLVTASNRDLKALVSAGSFREDLFFRVHVVRVDLPPLRERSGDLDLLIEHFLGRLSGAGRPIRLLPEARRLLVAHPFPGNVRELENALRRAALLSSGEPIDTTHLPPEIANGAAAEPGELAHVFAERRRARLKADRTVEREFLERALLEAGGNVSGAARRAGISRATLHRMLARHGLSAAKRRGPPPR